MLFFLNDFFFLLPEIFWVFSVTALLLFSTTLTNRYNMVLITNFGYISLFIIALLTFLCLQVPATEYCLLQFQYTFTLFNFWLRLIFLFFFAVCVYVSLNYFFIERVFFVEYFFLVGFFCISAFFLMSANDFILFYFAVELQALILYTLAALKRYTVFSTESGLKYFVLGALSSGLLLFGISLFYGFFGTFNFYDIKFLFLKWANVKFFYGAIMSIIFILVGLLFKLSAAPFHIWAPDVYEGAPTPIVLFFAILPKLAMFVFVVKFFLIWMYDISGIWYTVFFFCGLLSVFWGTFAALNQLSIKRLYAYSAITNIGYLLTTLSYGTYDSIVSVFNYLSVYFVSTITIFLIILLFRRIVSYSKVKFLVEYRLFASYSFSISIFFAIVFFSLAGIPPLAGFFVKFFLFQTMFAADFLINSSFFIILVLSVVSAFYYIRVVRFIFFDTTRRPFFFYALNPISCFFLVNSCSFIAVFALLQSSIYAVIGVLVNTLFF